jgi:hypothetical protein
MHCEGYRRFALHHRHHTAVYHRSGTHMCFLLHRTTILYQGAFIHSRRFLAVTSYFILFHPVLSPLYTDLTPIDPLGIHQPVAYLRSV